MANPTLTNGTRAWNISLNGTTVFTPPFLIWQPQVFVKFIEWFDILTQGDLLKIQDSTGAKVIPSLGQAGGDVQTFNVENWFNGLYLAEMDSGTLIIHIK